jgi:Zn-dependent peptidase ImmA (M78 family)
MARTGAMYDPDNPDPDEQYASAFAAALLMPEAAFRRVWAENLTRSRGMAVILTGLKFDVPPEAVRYRLHMLGLADR